MTDVKDKYNASSPYYDLRYKDLQMGKYRASIPDPALVNGFVLDVGCGTGLLGEYLGRTICGIDPSEGMLSFARGRLIPVIGDACRLPFPDKTFSWVFSYTVLQNIDDYETALSEISRVSVKNGKCILSHLDKPQFDAIGMMIEKYFLVEEKILFSEDIIYKCKVM